MGSPANGAETVTAAPIVKPLPPELFKALGTNAEIRWSAMRDQGYHVPVDRFFVRNHTSTPIIDADTWRLEVFGAGLRGGPRSFSLAELRRLPAETRSVTVECAGNGRGHFTTQQGQTVSGTAWGWAPSASPAGEAYGCQPCSGWPASTVAPSTYSRPASTRTSSPAASTSARCGARCRSTKP